MLDLFKKAKENFMLPHAVPAFIGSTAALGAIGVTPVKSLVAGATIGVLYGLIARRNRPAPNI